MSQVSRWANVTAYVEFDLAKAREYADKAGAKSDRERATYLGISAYTWSRLSNAKDRRVTATMIANVLTKRQDLKFYDLFRVASR